MRSPVWDGVWIRTQNFNDPCCRAAYAVFGLAGHNGIDVGLPVSTPLYAREAGVVTEAYNDPSGYGLTIYVVASDSGRGWRYGHLSRLDVSLGERVERRTQVGLSGNTGNSTGPHLHLGVRPPNPDHGNGFGGYVDPLPILEALDAENAALEETPPVDERQTALLAAVEASGITTAQEYTDLTTWSSEVWRQLGEVRAQLSDALAAQHDAAPAVVRVIAPAGVTVETEVAPG